MSETTQKIGGYEPSVRTVEMVCDRLAELGLAIGPDTARALVREIVAAEGPRIDARLRDSLDTALQTIKVAAQSAMGLLAATTSEARQKEAAPPPPEQLHVSRRPPAQQAPPVPPRRAPAPPAPSVEPRRGEPRQPEPRHAEHRRSETREPEPRQPEPRQPEPRRQHPDFDEDERRPIFRRPGRR
ncbi:MAG TPA: hypothetical protein VHG35_17330 [Gemmatimonadales bacterium]|nr:hypothetical protein [Gemmatimonadales bacterium]